MNVLFLVRIVTLCYVQSAISSGRPTNSIHITFVDNVAVLWKGSLTFFAATNYDSRAEVELERG